MVIVGQNGAMDHLGTPALEAGLHHIGQAPATEGRLELIVRRPAVDEREEVEAAQLDVERGLLGDRWGDRPRRSEANQVTIMSQRVISLIAGDRDRWALAGDQLYVDLDVSEENLPAGSVIAIGDAVLEVSQSPHTGCSKFASRFGDEALAWANTETGRRLRLRGMYARVVKGDVIRLGDTIRKV